MTQQLVTQPEPPNKYCERDLRILGGTNQIVLNLGCGQDATGIGIDIHYDPDIHHDLNDGIPIEDNTADKIIASHILEHLNNPTRLLTECRRVLKPDGILKIELPNIGWLPVRAWLTQDQHRFWQHKHPDRDGHWLARRLGNPDRKRTPHRTLWTKALLREHLDRAEFTYKIQGSHWSRNLHATATPTSPNQAQGNTLHELERATGSDIASGDYWAQTRARVMSHWVDQLDPDTILDIGCGSGYLTAQIAEADPTRSVVGIDNNSASIDVANTRQCPADFRVLDAYELDYDPDSFECVIYGDVLEHFEDPASLLAQAHDVLTPDGRVIVSVPALKSLYGPHDEHNEHHERYTTDRLQTVAHDADFHLTRTRYTNVVPLLPYFVYQRVLQRRVPTGTRGSHNPVVEWVKRGLIQAESRVPWPIGITLIAELAPACR